MLRRVRGLPGLCLSSYRRPLFSTGFGRKNERCWRERFVSSKPTTSAPAARLRCFKRMARRSHDDRQGEPTQHQEKEQMKYLLIVSALAALLGTAQATSRSADCCNGGGCCHPGSACCAK